MSPETKLALEKSIENWERIADEIPNPDISPGVENCPLCSLFYERDCWGCPVAEKTEVAVCFDSPYGEAADAFEIYLIVPSESALERWKRAARAEVDFLKSLLPKP